VKFKILYFESIILACHQCVEFYYKSHQNQQVSVTHYSSIPIVQLCRIKGSGFGLLTSSHSQVNVTRVHVANLLFYSHFEYKIKITTFYRLVGFINIWTVLRIYTCHKLYKVYSQCT